MFLSWQHGNLSFLVKRPRLHDQSKWQLDKLTNKRWSQLKALLSSFATVEYMLLLAGNIMPGVKKLLGDLLFPQEKGLFFSSKWILFHIAPTNFANLLAFRPGESSLFFIYPCSRLYPLDPTKIPFKRPYWQQRPHTDTYKVYFVGL